MTKNDKGQLEQAILFDLVQNAKEHIDIVAKHHGVSPQKVRRTIKQLESKQIILGYTTVFDEQKIGLKHFILLLKRSSRKVDENAIDTVTLKAADDIAAEFGITLENSAYIHGEYDWIASFTAKDIQQAKRLSNKLVTLYPHLVQEITILQTLMFVRKNYVLNPERTRLKEVI